MSVARGEACYPSTTFKHFPKYRPLKAACHERIMTPRKASNCSLGTPGWREKVQGTGKEGACWSQGTTARGMGKSQESGCEEGKVAGREGPSVSQMHKGQSTAGRECAGSVARKPSGISLAGGMAEMQALGREARPRS